MTISMEHKKPVEHLFMTDRYSTQFDINILYEYLFKFDVIYVNTHTNTVCVYVYLKSR